MFIDGKLVCYNSVVVLVRLSRTSEASPIRSSAGVQKPGLVFRPVSLKLCLLYADIFSPCLQA